MAMDRNHYRIFSPGSIAGLVIPNRLVRSATWDPSILTSRQMTEEVLNLYHNLALGGVGAIITGGFPVYRERFPEEVSRPSSRLYADLCVNGVEKMTQVVHQARQECKIIAQLEVGYLQSGPSSYVHPGKPEPGVVACICNKDKKLHHQAQKWLATWRTKKSHAG